MMWISFFFSFALAYIPKASTIVHKTVENNGSGSYQIEQEVQFSTNNQEPFILKESWSVESENKMKLIVTGTKEFKDKIHWVFLYESGIRSQFLNGQKVQKSLNDDFLEKYFHIRKDENFENILAKMKIVPPALFATKPYKLSKEPDFQKSPYLRLVRVGGIVAYALGEAPDTESDLKPTFFIEQDQFILRKFRLPSNVEVSADNYSLFARNLNFPKTRTVKWQDHQITIQTIQVLGKSQTSFNRLEPSLTTDLSDLGSAKDLVEEFYKRFR